MTNASDHGYEPLAYESQIWTALTDDELTALIYETRVGHGRSLRVTQTTRGAMIPLRGGNVANWVLYKLAELRGCHVEQLAATA